MTADGVELLTKSIRSAARNPIDTLVVPGGFLVEDAIRDRTLLGWITRTAPQCRRVCSVCMGSFLLAEAGILNGCRAATHWRYAPATTIVSDGSLRRCITLVHFASFDPPSVPKSQPERH
jgi:transcriptional regulator GlxA family with amidase domain